MPLNVASRRVKCTGATDPAVRSGGDSTRGTLTWMETMRWMRSWRASGSKWQRSGLSFFSASCVATVKLPAKRVSDHGGRGVFGSTSILMYFIQLIAALQGIGSLLVEYIII